MVIGTCGKSTSRPRNFPMMERTGRNEPCPCGSGRKYKKCCLAHEAEREAIVESIFTDALPLLSQLGRFAEQAAGMSLERVARAEFPFWQGKLSKAQGARVVDYLMFDFRPKLYARRTVDEFAIEVGPTLSPAARAMLAAWLDAQRRPYRIESWSGKFTTCVDVLDGDARPISVFDVEEEWRPRTGSVAVLRPLQAGPGFFIPSQPLGFGDRTPADVGDDVRRRHLDYVRSERIVGIEEFLRSAPTALDEELSRRPSASTIIVPGS